MNTDYLNKNITEVFPEGLLEKFVFLVEYLKDQRSEILIKAIKVAGHFHRKTKRLSGDLYVTHPLETCEILIRDFGIRVPQILTAAILHDTVEDCPGVTLDYIVKHFGTNIAEFVDGVTKLKLSGIRKSIKIDMTHQKLLQFAAEKPEVILIKIADRLHNMQTLQYIDSESTRVKKASETLTVYVPITAKFNLTYAKRKLSELSLMHLFPKKSKLIKKKIKQIQKSDTLLNVENLLKKEFSTLPFKVHIRSRVKNLWSFYSYNRKKFSLDNADNLVDYTVIVKSNEVLDCYLSLGIINKLFKPIPRSIRDYIANPKSNGYQSLHVRVRKDNILNLFKIRTSKMHTVSNRGILLYWDNKKKYEGYKNLIRNVLTGIGRYKGSPNKRRDMLHDLTQQEIYLNTPRGGRHILPKNSIVIDLGFEIHTDLGEKCAGAFVNGKRVESSHKLEDSDFVEIIKSPTPAILDPEIESICKTAKAKTYIRKCYQKKLNQYATKIGRQILLDNLKKYEILERELIVIESMKNFLEYRNLKTIDDLYLKIGQDLITPKEIIWELVTHSAIIFERHIDCIMIDKIENGIHKFSKCCHPFPGETNIKAVLSVRGMSFHKASCKKLLEDHLVKERSYIVRWNKDKWGDPIELSAVIKDMKLSKFFKFFKFFKENIYNLEFVSLKKIKNDVHFSIRFSSFEKATFFYNSFKEKHKILIKKFIVIPNI